VPGGGSRSVLRGRAFEPEKSATFPENAPLEVLRVEPVAGALGALLCEAQAGTLRRGIERFEQILAIDAKILEAGAVVVEKRLQRDALSTPGPGLGEPVHQGDKRVGRCGSHRRPLARKQ